MLPSSLLDQPECPDHARQLDVMRDEKRALRDKVLALRQALSATERQQASLELVRHADAIGPVDGKVVSGFWPIRGEIDPRPLMHSLKARGARLALPVIVDKTTIIFRAYLSDAALIDAGFGTRGPDSDAETLDPDLMLVPLAVFSPGGGRIGYGAGYYDRAIARLIAADHAPFTIGIAFALQQVADIPQGEHDIYLDRVLTPEGFAVTGKIAGAGAAGVAPGTAKGKTA